MRRLSIFVLATFSLFGSTAAAAPPAKKGPTVSKPVKSKKSLPLREIVRRQEERAAREANGNKSPERKVLDEYLSKYRAARYAGVIPISSPELKMLFPKTAFFALRFRLYPVAVAPPKPLRTQNVFAVTGKTTLHLKSANELGKYFQKNLPPVKTGKAASVAAAAFLRLSQEFSQDGFFKFQKPVVKLSAGKGGPIADGVSKVVMQRGDRGSVTVHMSFLAGKLESVKPGGKVSPGIRPRCQATRLLHPDPAVRDIMRRDLIVLGSSAKWYFAEQWEKANPPLRNAIENVWQQICEEGR